jgi:hypothetical protein
MRERVNTFASVLLLLLGAVLVTSCSSPRPVPLPIADQVATLRVTHRWGTGSVEIARTADAEAIHRALGALSELNSAWRSPWYTYPTPEYTASFHTSAGTVLVVAWVGPNWLGAATLAEMPKATRLRSLTPEERESVLNALGVH